MASSELASIAASSGTTALIAAAKYVKYPFKVDENTSALESAMSELEAMKKDVMIVKDKTKKIPDFPTSTVDKWLDEVSKVKNEVEVISSKYQHRHRIIHIICSDYKISRHAEKELLQVKRLCGDEIIKDLIKHAQKAASQQSPGVGFNVIGKKFDFSVHLGKK